MLGRSLQTPQFARFRRGAQFFIVVCAAQCLAIASLAAAIDSPIRVSKTTVFAGRSVAAVLKELSGRNRQFIYSSQLLPSSVRVLQEPAMSDALDIAREILKPHHLSLSAVAPGVYAVMATQDIQQTISITGRIVDVRDDEPIDNAELRLMPGSHTTHTDDNGNFAFKDLNIDRYRLHVSRPGYEPRELLFVPAAAETKLDIPLQASRYVLEGTLVTASRYPFGVKTKDSSLTLAGGPLSSQSSLGEDPIRALARLPGVSQSGLNGALNIRGGASNEVLILLDDLPLRQAFHMPGYRSLLSVFDPGVVSEVNVYTGAIPARYGGRMSGVLDITSVDALLDPRRSFGLGFLSGRARVGQALGEHGDAMVAARYGAFGYLSDIIDPATGHPSYADVFNRAHLQIGESTHLSVNALLARDSLNIHRDGLNENGQLDSESAYVWLRGQTLLNDNEKLSLTVGRTFLDQSRVGDLVSPALASGNLDENRRSEIWDVRARAELALSRHAVELGAEWNHGTAEYSYDKELQFAPVVVQRFPLLALRAQDRTLAPSREESAAFISDRWAISSRFNSQVGLRAMHHAAADNGSRTVWDPRAALAYSVSGATEVRLAWGRVHQFIDVTEIAVEDAFDPDPAPQESEYFVLGYEHQIQATTMLRLETYYKEQAHVLPRFQNFVNSASILPELSFDRIFVAPRSANIRGAELYVQQSGDPWSWRLAYAWSEAQESIGDFEVPRDWDQRNVATLGLEWTRGPWQLNAAGIFRSGRPTTRLVNLPGGGIAVGLRNADRLDSYFGIDLRAAWRKHLASGTFSAALQVTNALNRRNECCSALSAQTDANGNPSLYVVPGKTSPLIPWAGIAYDF